MEVVNRRFKDKIGVERAGKDAVNYHPSVEFLIKGVIYIGYMV